MPEAFTEAMYHEIVRTYRRELELESRPLERGKLITLIARAKMQAQEHGWPTNVD